VRFLPEYDNALASHADRTILRQGRVGALSTRPDRPRHVVDGAARTWIVGDGAEVGHLEMPRRDARSASRPTSALFEFEREPDPVAD
jgi:hypothetical protein